MTYPFESHVPLWSLTEHRVSGLPDDYRSYRKFHHTISGETTIISEERFGDEWWIHFSTVGTGAPVPWRELVRRKELFLGPDCKGVAVIPARSEYVNLHPYCLHLFVAIGRDPLPDFRRLENGVWVI